VPIAAHVTRRGRSIWTRLSRNLRRLPQLRARAAPQFLWERVVNLGTELVGTLAYSWSVRLRRPCCTRRDPTVRRCIPAASRCSGPGTAPRPPAPPRSGAGIASRQAGWSCTRWRASTSSC
jgi:hypothetical protein